MAKKSQQSESEDIIVNVEEVYSKTEQFIEKHQLQILGALGIIIFVVLGYFSYVRFYLGPLEEEANSQMFTAEQYFQRDDFETALNGDATYLGFLDIADQYGSTKAGNLARYYAGISYLRTEAFEEAIDQLKRFKSGDVVLKAVALGAIGDAYMELGDDSNALSYYEQASKASDNEFTAPVYLMKAGLAAEKAGKMDKAISHYGRIRDNYASTAEGRNVEKYIARAQGQLN